jgi:hypothetical protein
MARISQRKIGQFLAAGQAAATTGEKGKALEDLICYLFECIPGISVTQRNTLDVFQAEEVDVAFWNDQHHQGIWFLPNLLLVECKNWSVPVSNDEVVFFDEKLRRRGLSFGILVAANGITGDPARRTAAHATIAGALAEQRKLIVLTIDEIKTFTDGKQVIALIKRKLCELAVAGTLFAA